MDRLLGTDTATRWVGDVDVADRAHVHDLSVVSYPFSNWDPNTGDLPPPRQHQTFSTDPGVMPQREQNNSPPPF